MDQTRQLNLDSFWQQLEPAGLNLLACVPAKLFVGLRKSQQLPDGCEYLLLVGNSGRTVWDRLQEWADANILTTINTIDMQSPCLSCADTPCVHSCPADALEVGAVPDLKACVSHRIQDGSSCANTCIARTACPLAKDLQYSEDQLAYFYGRSLASAIRWTEQQQ